MLYLFAIFTKRLKKKKKNQYPGHEHAIFYTIDVRVWRSCLLREGRKKNGFNPEKIKYLIVPKKKKEER